MNSWMNPWKTNTSLVAASALMLLLTACGGSPPPLPPPPTTTNTGGFYSGSATCGSMIGTPVNPTGPVTAAFSNGATATLNFGYQGASLTGSASFNLPSLGGNTSYTSTSTSSVICLSTVSSSGVQQPGQFNINGGYIYIVANLYSTVPYFIIPQYGLPVLGTGYGGAPTQYAQASGYIAGYLINGTFVSGQAQVTIPQLNYSSGPMYTSNGSTGYNGNTGYTGYNTGYPAYNGYY